MKALGMIETIGMVGAIEALDVALKTADVEVLNRHIVKGGIVTVEIIGDVGAIKVAVDAGAEAAKRLGVFVSSHVIPRPDEMVFQMIEIRKNDEIEKPVEVSKEEVKEVAKPVETSKKEEKEAEKPIETSKETKSKEPEKNKKNQKEKAKKTNKSKKK